MRELNNSSSDDFWYITIRRTMPGTFYGAGWYHGSLSPDCYIFKVINYVYTQLATGNCDMLSDGHIVSLQAVGDTLTFSKDGVVKVTATGGNAVTAAGTGGWGAGNIRNANDDLTEGESVDDFSIVTMSPTPTPTPTQNSQNQECKKTLA